MEFKDILRQLRKAKGMTQTELGKALGLSVSAISSYETGTRFPDFETQEAMADFFNISIDTLRGNEQFDIEVATANDKAKIIIELTRDISEDTFKRLLSYAEYLRHYEMNGGNNDVDTEKP